MPQWAYDMKDDELVVAFGKACAQAGTASSGLVIDMFAAEYVAHAHYLKGVLLARLARKKPPFRIGDAVRPIKDGLLSTDFRTALPARKSFTIRKVYYTDAGKWLVVPDIPGAIDNPPLFDADKFALIPKT